MAIDELTSRLKDKSLLKLQAFIGGHWVRHLLVNVQSRSEQ